MLNHRVRGASMVFEGASWDITLGQFRATKDCLSYFEASRRSKNPTPFTG